VTASGPGLERSGVMVNRKTYFDVHTRNCGTGVVDVAVLDPMGRKDTVRPMVARKSDDNWYVEYTPVVDGPHSVNIFFAGKAIPNSPYPVGVSAEGGPMVDPARVPPGKLCPPVDALERLLHHLLLRLVDLLKLNNQSDNNLKEHRL